MCLSATVSNAEEVAAWIETVRGEHRRRHRGAPAGRARRNLYLVGERGADDLHLLPDVRRRGPDGELRPNPEAARLDARGARDPRRRGAGPAAACARRAASRSSSSSPSEAMLPAIVLRLQPRRLRPGGRAVPRRRAAAHRRRRARASIRRDRRRARPTALADDDLDVLGYDAWLAGLEAGIAAHHAGMVPPMKEAVEEAFAAGLVKVVFATETLSLGHQHAGALGGDREAVEVHRRAPRVPHAGGVHPAHRPGRAARHRRPSATRSCCWSPFVPFDQVAALASRRTYALTSSFRPTYNMAANLVRRYPTGRGPPPAQPVVRAVPRRPRRRGARAPARAQPRAARAPARGRRVRPRRRRGVPARSLAELETCGATAARGRRHRRRARRAAPGRRRARAPRAAAGSWCSSTSAAGGGSRVLGAHAEPRRRPPRPARLRRARRAGRDDRAARGRSRRAARRSSAQAADALRRAQLRDDGGRRPTTTDAVDELESRARRRTRWPTMPRARRRTCGPPARSSASSATSHRLERRVRGPQREPGPPVRPRARACSSRGATSTAGSSPTPGELLARLYTETDLLLAEALRDGLLDGLDAARARRGRVVLHLRAARPRRRRRRCRRARWPTKTVADACARDRADLARPQRQRGRRRPARDPAARSRVHAVDVRLGGGRRPRRRARRRRDDRRRLRPQREAVHRPAPPGRRRRARPEHRATRPGRRPTRASAGVVAASSVVGRAAACRDRARASRGGARRRRPGRRRGRRATTPPSPPRSRGAPGRAACGSARHPTSDLARAVGLAADAAPSGTLELAVRRCCGSRPTAARCAVNMVVLGVAARPAAGWTERRRRAAGRGRRPGGARRPATSGRRRQRPVPPRARPRAPRAIPATAGSRSRSTRCAAAERARDARAGCPQGAHLPAPADRDQPAAGAVEVACRGRPVPLEVDGVARAGGDRGVARRRRARRLPLCSSDERRIAPPGDGRADTIAGPSGRRGTLEAETDGMYALGALHRRRSGHPPAVLHEPRPAGVRARQPARGREGRAVRPLLALRQEPAPPVPRRVRRRPRPHRRPHRRRDRRAASAPRSSTTACSSSTATTPSRSSAACTSRASRRRTCSRRSSSGAGSWRTSSSRRATSRTTRRLGGRYRYLPRRPRCSSRRSACATSPTSTRCSTPTREMLPDDARLGARALPEGAGRLRLRLQADDQGEGVRRGPRHPARGDALERRHLRHRPGATRRCCCACARTRCPRRAATRD